MIEKEEEAVENNYFGTFLCLSKKKNKKTWKRGAKHFLKKGGERQRKQNNRQKEKRKTKEEGRKDKTKKNTKDTQINEKFKQLRKRNGKLRKIKCCTRCKKERENTERQ